MPITQRISWQNLLLWSENFFGRGVFFTTPCFIIPLKGEVIVVVVIMIGGVIDVLLMSGNLLIAGSI